MMAWVWAVCLVLSGRWLLNLVSPGVVAKAESIGLVDNSDDGFNTAKEQVEASPETKKENKDAKGGTLKDRTNERTVGDDYLDFGEENGWGKKKSPEIGDSGFVAVKAPGGGGGGHGENNEPESEMEKMKRDIAKSLK